MMFIVDNTMRRSGHLQTALERPFVPATIKSNIPASRPNIVSEIIGIIKIIKNHQISPKNHQKSPKPPAIPTNQPTVPPI